MKTGPSCLTPEQPPGTTGTPIRLPALRCGVHGGVTAGYGTPTPHAGPCRQETHAPPSPDRHNPNPSLPRTPSSPQHVIPSEAEGSETVANPNGVIHAHTRTPPHRLTGAGRYPGGRWGPRADVGSARSRRVTGPPPRLTGVGRYPTGRFANRPYDPGHEPPMFEKRSVPPGLNSYAGGTVWWHGVLGWSPRTSPGYRPTPVRRCGGMGCWGGRRARPLDTGLRR